MRTLLSCYRGIYPLARSCDVLVGLAVALDLRLGHFSKTYQTAPTQNLYVLNPDLHLPHS